MTSPTLPGTACATVLVDWDGLGTFAGPYDDVTLDVPGDPGVSVDLGKDGARSLSPPKVSSCDFVLRNDDGQYSQEHAGSPVYQRVIPGRPVRVEVEHGTAGTYDAATPYDETDYYDGIGAYALARTAIDDISQSVALGQQTVTLRTLGIETLLVGTTVTVGLMTAPLVSECITALLDAVGWPSGQRSIAISDTRLLYWWCDDRTPWDAIGELLAAEGPCSFYLTAENGGTLHFENRNYRTTQTRCTTPQAAFYDRRGSGLTAYYDEAAPYDAPDAYDGETDVRYFTSLSYDPGFRNIYNAARYPTHRRTLGALGVIWTYGTTLTPSASGTTLIVHPTDPFSGAVVPVLTTDYTVAGGTVSMSLSATSGLVAFLTVTATSGTPVVSGLQLRAQPLTIVGETTATHTIDTSASQARFSPIPGQSIPRVMDVAGWPEIDLVVAQAVCDAWITRYQLQRPAVTIEVRNVDGPHLTEILRRTISDRISLREHNSGLAADVWINSKAITISSGGGRDVRAVFGCEKIDEVSGSRWDAAASLWDTALWGI